MPQHATIGCALSHYTDQLLNNMDPKTFSFVALLDMSKAFDSVRHDLLVLKLRRLGVSDSARAWFESYVLSDHLPLTVGVAQGSILGPACIVHLL